MNEILPIILCCFCKLIIIDNIRKTQNENLSFKIKINK